MIITQTHKRRTFVGSMNVGTDLIQALKTICVDNTIFCADFTATGYLEDVTLVRFDGRKNRYGEPVQHPGTFHAVGLNGNISLADRQTVVRCHAIGTISPETGEHALVSGELTAGKVVAVEFNLTTHDDIRLYRERDDRTGLEAWLRVEFGDGPPIVRDDAPLEVLATAVTPEPPPAILPKDEPHVPHDLDISEGDYLNHPALGLGEVVATDAEERVSIRLESGRVVELHLGLLEVVQVTTEGRRRTFKVTIKRRPKRV
ncbi:MAG: DUF296 domain-containing protein [Deltaproteobacteria bacterium]|nr:MAG: DUF296 domain-containing protein [Deltaproteobacteria bacterium]